MPSLNTCVKSLATIDLFPAPCNVPSIFSPVQPNPNVVTFCMYGDLEEICTDASDVPEPGSKLTYAPANGRLVL